MSSFLSNFLSKISWKGIVLLIIGTGLIVVLIETNWFGSLVYMLFGSIWDGTPSVESSTAIDYIINGCRWVNYLYGFNFVAFAFYFIFTFIRVSLGVAYMKFLLWFAEKIS